ncbi:hypothetical protein [Candidatus Cardinium hertigii]|nr:hypothetical protein [Candidatus Cardinium hertigii]
MEKLAVIDLGTNVIKVLVGIIGQAEYRVLYEEKFIGTMSKQPLWQAAISLVDKKNIVDILVRIKQKIDIIGVKYIVAKATSLLREAPNATEIISDIRVATDIEVEIISGVEEANLIYLGISASLTLTKQNGNDVIIDIGGGSVECIIFNHEQQLWEKSFELGIRRVASLFSYNDPITTAQVADLEKYYHTVLGSFFAAANLYKPRKLIGSSGAFRTLLMLYKLHYPCTTPKANDTIKNISIEQFLKIYHIILTTPVGILENKICIEPAFLRLVPLSATLVKLIMQTCNLQEIMITDNSLITGLFIREWNRLRNKPYESYLIP